VGARDDHARAALHVERQLLRAREHFAALGQLARQQRAQEVGRGRFGDPLGRPHALDLRGDHRRQQPAHRRARLDFRADVQHADDAVGHAQRDAVDPLAAGQQRALLGGRSRGDRERGAPGVGHREARLERLCRRAHDLGQAGPRLDRLGDRVERREVGHPR
jgi:hypothetical protein